MFSIIQMIASNFTFPQDFIDLSKATPSLDKLWLVSNCSMMLEGFAASGCSNLSNHCKVQNYQVETDNWDDSQLSEEKNNSQTSKNHSRKIILDP